jgi:hypothetical protein
MPDNKDTPFRPTRQPLREDKGAVLPVAPSSVPMPGVKPTQGARPDKPVKAKD